jgi:hypothetical protein
MTQEREVLSEAGESMEHDAFATLHNQVQEA